MSSTQRLAVQIPEQQSEPSTQSSPLLPQTDAAHAPPMHASEQQSCARVHAAEARLQYPRHPRFGVPGIGSQRPEQH